MECDTDWILCGAWSWRKGRPFVKWVRSVKGLTVGYVSRMMWFDNSHSLWTLREPKKPVKGLQLLQLSHDPLSGTKYQTFVGSDWMSCVVLIWISLKGNHENISVKQWANLMRTSHPARPRKQKRTWILNAEPRIYMWTRSQNWQDQLQ